MSRDRLVNKGPRGLVGCFGHVRAYDRSGTDVNATPLTIIIAAPTFNASLTWVASALAHESVHAPLYLAHQPYTELAAEQEANAYQPIVLMQIGAPQSEIWYMLSQTKAVTTT